MLNGSQVVDNSKMKVDNEAFVQEALYDKFKKIFADDVWNALLNQKEIWISEDVGYLTAEIKNQGTRSGQVIKNVKLKFVPSKKLRKEANKKFLGKG